MTAGRVVVVGGGPVGLSAAILCHRAGIDCTLLEQDEHPPAHPKARGIRTRTMELFAQWGIADDLRSGALPAEANRFIYCDTLAGEEVARSPETEGSVSSLSPESVCRVAQDRVETVLRDHVRALDRIDYRAGARVVGVSAADAGAQVHLADGDAIAGDFVIGADGVASTVRRVLDIAMEGQPVLGWGQSVYWEADLGPLVADRLCIQFMTGDRPGHPASIATVDGRTRWVTMVMRPASDQRPEPLSEDEARVVIDRAIGADSPVRILDITTWRLSAQVAAQWRSGPVFLAGDAAHSFPPTGGFGMNTGVQDVHNLVWKLNLVLGGHAGDRLLDSYQRERKAVAASNAAWSVANGGRFRAIGRAIAAGDQGELSRLLDEQRTHVDASAQDLGFGYQEGALIRDPGEPADDVLRVARTGHRFPETTVSIGDRVGSSVLHFTDGFVIATTDPGRWTGPAAATAAAGIPLAVASVADRRVLAERDAVLVRPDGVVAWAIPALPDDQRLPALTDAMRELLW